MNGEADLTIVREDGPETTTLIPKGSIDKLSSETLRALLHDLAAGGPNITILSMGSVTMIDSGGIGMLVSAKKDFETAKRRLIIRSVPERITRVLKLLRLYDYLVVDS